MPPLDVPLKHEAMYHRVMEGKSPKAAIRIYCLNCQGWNSSWVRECKDRWYPSYPYRLPRTSKVEAQDILASTPDVGDGDPRIDDLPQDGPLGGAEIPNAALSCLVRSGGFVDSQT